MWLEPFVGGQEANKLDGGAGLRAWISSAVRGVQVSTQTLNVGVRGSPNPES